MVLPEPRYKVTELILAESGRQKLYDLIWLIIEIIIWQELVSDLKIALHVYMNSGNY